MKGGCQFYESAMHSLQPSRPYQKLPRRKCCHSLLHHQRSGPWWLLLAISPVSSVDEQPRLGSGVALHVVLHGMLPFPCCVTRAPACALEKSWRTLWGESCTHRVRSFLHLPQCRWESPSVLISEDPSISFMHMACSGPRHPGTGMDTHLLGCT